MWCTHYAISVKCNSFFYILWKVLYAICIFVLHRMYGKNERRAMKGRMTDGLACSSSHLENKARSFIRLFLYKWQLYVSELYSSGSTMTGCPRVTSDLPSITATTLWGIYGLYIQILQSMPAATRMFSSWPRLTSSSTVLTSWELFHNEKNITKEAEENS